MTGWTRSVYAHSIRMYNPKGNYVSDFDYINFTLHTRCYTKIVLFNDSKFSYFYLSRNTLCPRLHYFIFRFRSTSHFYLNNKLDKWITQKTTTTNFIDSTISGSIVNLSLLCMRTDWEFTIFLRRKTRAHTTQKFKIKLCAPFDALFINIYKAGRYENRKTNLVC